MTEMGTYCIMFRERMKVKLLFSRIRCGAAVLIVCLCVACLFVFVCHADSSVKAASHHESHLLCLNHQTHLVLRSSSPDTFRTPLQSSVHRLIVPANVV